MHILNICFITLWQCFRMSELFAVRVFEHIVVGRASATEAKQARSLFASSASFSCPSISDLSRLLLHFYLNFTKFYRIFIARMKFWRRIRMLSGMFLNKYMKFMLSYFVVFVLYSLAYYRHIVGAKIYILDEDNLCFFQQNAISNKFSI